MPKPKKNRGPTPPGASPISGVVPPVDTRWKSGETGNPGGRPSVGASAKEWMNILDEKVQQGELDEDGLRAVARDKRMPPSKRAAATRLLHMIESSDLADYDDLCDGTTTLSKLREKGVNTAVVKKIKTRRLYDKDGKDTGVEREVELHNRTGEDFDRVLDRTVGRPTQEIVAHHDGSIRSLSDGETAADLLLAEIRARLGVAGRDAGGN